jgi:hypothetical protein
MFAMFSNLATPITALIAPPLGELTSPWSDPHIRPTSLQLMLIGLGTLAAYSAAKRFRAFRRVRTMVAQRQQELARESPTAARMPMPAPHFAEDAAPISSEPPEQHAA